MSSLTLIKPNRVAHPEQLLLQPAVQVPTADNLPKKIWTGQLQVIELLQVVGTRDRTQDHSSQYSW